MTRHLVRLMWNRKRHNFLLAVEIFVSFLVLFAVVLVAVIYTNNWRQGLGYDIDRVWRIAVDTKEPAGDASVRQRHLAMFRELVNEIRGMPGIEGVAATSTVPYSGSTWTSGYRLRDGRTIRFGTNFATDSFAEVLRLQIVDGRWFSREDEGAAWRPTVLNRRMAHEIFGDARAVGQIVPVQQDPEAPGPERRVVGVIEEFRKNGEFATPENFAFDRIPLEKPNPRSNVPEMIVVRVAPGTPAQIEETLVTRLQSMARTWSFEVAPLAAMRETMLNGYITPLVGFGTVAAFLLLMVALGLTGVVWQSVTQRTREFGLRRAKGATIPNVRAQVLGELVIMTSIALLAAVGLVVQLPLLPRPPDIAVAPGVFAASVAISAATIYLLTLVCGWYPSRLATRIPPAEALHYE